MADNNTTAIDQKSWEAGVEAMRQAIIQDMSSGGLCIESGYDGNAKRYLRGLQPGTPKVREDTHPSDSTSFQMKRDPGGSWIATDWAFVRWVPGANSASLDGEFSADDLISIAAFMKDERNAK